MIRRCYETGHKLYPQYGGRGIKVCRPWRDSFETFAEDMGPRPHPKYVLVRRNQRGDFSPSNCYWGPMSDCQRKRATLITYKGKTQNIAHWSEELGINRETIRKRLMICEELGLEPSAVFTFKFKRGPRKRT
jgi:hypothetical protein